MPVTDYSDVFHALGVEEREAKTTKVHGSNDAEQVVLDLLASGLRDGEVLLAESNLDGALFNQTLTMLEITGKIRSLGAGQWSLQ